MMKPTALCAKLLLAAALALGPATSAFAGAGSATETRDYYIVDVNDDAAAVIDVASISAPSNGVVRYMEVLIYKQPQTDEQFVVLATVLDADCKGKRKRSVSDLAYDADMKSLGETQQNGDWKTPDAGSIAAAEIEYVCGDRSDKEHVVTTDYGIMRRALQGDGK